ncbi:MAG: ribulokinase, partial [Sphaerochaetaceae bacterium]
MEKNANYVVGADFGSDSVRVVVIDAADGKMVASAVANYPRWSEGKYCDPKKNQFRQHPLDYIESFEKAIKEAGQEAPEAMEKVRAI